MNVYFLFDSWLKLSRAGEKYGLMFFFTVDWGCIVILNKCKKCIHITNEDTDQTPTSVAKGAWKVTASEGSSDKSLIQY